MTTSTSPNQPFRYSKLGYLALNVTDLERSIAFYRDMVGMELVESRAGEYAFLRCTDQHHELALYPSAVAGVKRVAFEMESAGDLDRAIDGIQALGVKIERVSDADARAMHVKRAARFRVPGAELPFEIYEGMDQGSTWKPTVAKLTRMGHVVFQIKNWETSVPWLLDKANFRTSDLITGWIAFLRCFPNPLHHSLGLGRSEKTHLHHFMFMVSDIDDIGKAINRFRKGGVPVTFGPGRHVASTSIFLYFTDPDGMTIEYSFGMERFDEHAPRAARDLKPGLETVDEWGGAPSPGYAQHGAVEGAA